MKYFGSILDFTHERNADIMRAFRHHLQHANAPILTPELFRRVSISPASRFWVSEERAAIVISAMAAGRPLPKMRPNRLAMFREIYRRFLIRKKEFPHKTILELVSDIVLQPAPRFYLSPRTIGEIIYHIKNGWYDKKYDRNRIYNSPQ